MTDLMQVPDPSNALFSLAAEMVNYSAQNIFITGKAGTGKTTFLKYIKENCAKQIVITAPTGVAAINAGGTTLHSFFQLPLSPFIPIAGYAQGGGNTEINTSHNLLSRLRYNDEKRKVLQALELLIIDEISMVRCDIPDAIDTILRHFRNSNKPFGGVQVIFIGDMYQLPPVVQGDEWNILSRFYKSQYFFSSHVISQNMPAFISFEKIYRQSDEKFINLLNNIRTNSMDEDSFELLEKYYQPGFKPSPEDEYIILTSHNYKADQINASELAALGTMQFTFKATISGEFADKAFPADEEFHVKEGAVVMFIKNDQEKKRRYYNGKTGKVVKIDQENIHVQCINEDEIIIVNKETWENIRYTFDKSSHQLTEEVIGTFSQFPLRLSWAITIHKSQGLTFEKAVIDAGESFAPGQVYVALSRCTNLDGLILRSKIKGNSLETDPRIAAFLKNISSIPQLKEQLTSAKQLYQQSLISGLFDLSTIVKQIQELELFLKENLSSFNPDSVNWSQKVTSNLILLEDVATRFRRQLDLLFGQRQLPGENLLVQDRIIPAAKYFADQLQTIQEQLQRSPVITDSRIKAKEYNQKLFDIFSMVAEKKFMMAGCENGFDLTAWHTRRNEFKIPPFTVNAYAGVSNYSTIEHAHPVLYQQLRKTRDEICAKNYQPIYMVAGSVTLNEMTRYLPQNMEELAQISGFGKARLGAYGERFLEVINRYCEIHQIGSLIHEKLPKSKGSAKKTGLTETKSETFQLYKSGKSVAEIAARRNFKIETIEGHLVYYVQTGEIKIDELLSSEKINLIEPLVKNFEGSSLTTIKQQLGDAVTYNDIRLMLAWCSREKSHV
jgi:hypothetical protein